MGVREDVVDAIHDHLIQLRLDLPLPLQSLVLLLDHLVLLALEYIIQLARRQVLFSRSVRPVAVTALRVLFGAAFF